MRTSKRKCPDCNQPLLLADLHKFNGRITKTYPKEIPAQNAEGNWFNFHEHRFYCQNCKHEWIYSTQDRSFSELPDGAQFVFDVSQGILVPNRLTAVI